MYILEPKEFGEFDNERTILKEWSTSQLGIPDVVVDDEQFTPRLVFPSQTKVGAKRVGAGVVLQQSAKKHSWCQGIGQATSDQFCGEPTLWKIDVVDRNTGRDGELWCNFKTPLPVPNSCNVPTKEFTALQ